MDFLQRALAQRGVACEHRALASPLTTLSADGIPPMLREMAARFGLESAMHERRLSNQFSFLEDEAPPAETILINLFHENEPLFSHKTERYVFFLDSQIWEEQPGVAHWMKKQFELVQPNPLTYLDRFGRMLERLRARFPLARILLVSRLKAYPAFGPQPYSYLKEWPSFQDQASAAYAEWSERFGCSVLDTERVFAGIWAEAPSIAAHCPFLRVTLEERDGIPVRMELARDIEHVGPLWARLAEKAEGFLKTGELVYGPKESVPASWSAPTAPERPAQLGETLERLLAGGSNYGWARAVGAMLCDPGQDYCALLAEHGQAAPVCHNLLHMIDKYSRIHKNPALAEWCAAHRPAAMAFHQNGPLFRRNYLERVNQIQTRVSQGG
jgi:hypothetical protein